MTRNERGHVAKLVLTATEIVGEFLNGQAIGTFASPRMTDLVDKMLEHGVELTARRPIVHRGSDTSSVGRPSSS
jgi:hypothetical protein